ncbi:MAG: DUF1573 domain-containing protein [Candidatus Omnitrophota bacterium]
MKKGLAIFLCAVLFSIPVFAQGTEALRQELYSKIKCKRCINMTIDKCQCPDAKEMRGYIDGLLEAELSRDEIFYKVAKKYSPNMITDVKIREAAEKRLLKEIGNKRPQIVIEPATFNFKEAYKKQGIVKKEFKIYNKGNEKLIITNIKASCVCASASLTIGKTKSPDFGTKGAGGGWQAIIKSGESGVLEVNLDLAHASIRPGKLTRTIHVTSSDPLNPEITVSVEAEVKE